MIQMRLVMPAVLGILLLVGCGGSKEAEEETEGISPEETQYIESAKPFVDALVARDYSKAFAQLSSHAKTRMSLNQFIATDDSEEFAVNESRAVLNSTESDFFTFLLHVESKYGKPSVLKNLYVQSMDPDVLSGTGDPLDVMFSIGLMPESIPTEIRRASIRGQIVTKLSPEQMEKAASDYGTTVEELEKDTEFSPYFTVKIVLVEEEGVLRVGYFEFVPPSIWD